MSIQAVVWVIEQSQSRLADRCVLISIANHCDRQGKNAWPSVDTISHEAKVSPRQVQLSLARLHKTGELSIARNQGPNGTNLYALPMMTEGNPSLLAQLQGASKGGAKSAGVQNPQGEKSAPPGVQNAAQSRQNSAPEPSFESSFKPSSAALLSHNGGAHQGDPITLRPWRPPLPVGAAVPDPDPWKSVKHQLEATTDPQSWATWFRPTRLGYGLNGTLVVRVPNREWEYAAERFADQIKEAVKALKLPYSHIEFQYEHDFQGKRETARSRP